MNSPRQAALLSITARLATAAGACGLTISLLQSMLALAEPQRSQLAATRQPPVASASSVPFEARPLRVAAR